MFKFFLYKFGQFSVNRLPLKISYCFAGYLSDIQYYFSFRDRRAVKENLKILLQSDDDRILTKYAKEVFRNFGKYLIEFFRIAQNVDKEYVNRKITIKNVEILNSVLEKGKGGIILSAHIGNWELGGVVVSVLDYPVEALALPHKERPVNDLFNQQRESKGVKVIPSNISVKRCIESLKQNKFLCMLGDRSFTVNGEVMDFLGRKMLIPKGPALFSAKTGAPIIPAFLIRDQNDHFTFSFLDPIFPPERNHEGISHEDLITIMGKYIRIIEDQVRKFPSQWLMFRTFWVNQ